MYTASDILPGSRISTEFPNVTRAFFEGLGIPVTVEYSYGATEAKVPELVDALVDLTETGETLRRNGLKIVDVVLTSTTRLLASKAAWADPEKRREIEEIRTLLLGVIEARGRVLLSMNVVPNRLTVPRSATACASCTAHSMSRWAGWASWRSGRCWTSSARTTPRCASWYEHEPAIFPILDAVQLPVRPNSHVFQFTSLDIKGEIIQPSQHHAVYVNYLLSGNAPREHLPHSCLTAPFSSVQSSHQIENSSGRRI